MISKCKIQKIKKIKKTLKREKF